MDQMKRRSRLLYGILIPVCFVVSMISPKFYNPKLMDFSVYWQAGHMILAGQDVYDSTEWLSENKVMGIAPQAGPTFQYPLPFAILFSLLGMLPIDTAYKIWTFLSQVAILASILILLEFYPKRHPYLDIWVMAGIFLFRPVFITIFSGQVVALLLLVIAVAICLFQQNKWFWGGILLSFLTFKPSLGLPFLVLTGLWFLLNRHRSALLGMLVGGMFLYLLGAVVDPSWVINYVSLGEDYFTTYYGMQVSLWGLSGYLFKAWDWNIWIGVVSVIVLLAVVSYYLWSSKLNHEPFFVFAALLPVAQLIAPYSWAHDQILQVISILFILILVAGMWGNWIAVTFLVGIDILAAGLVFIAYGIGYDVWSVMVPVTLLILVLILAGRQRSRHVLF